MNSKPKVAVTLGDPAGIGPEVTVKALAAPEVSPAAEWIVVGARAVAEDAARQFGCELPPGLCWEDVAEPKPGEFEIGKVSARCGAAFDGRGAAHRAA